MAHAKRSRGSLLIACLGVVAVTIAALGVRTGPDATEALTPIAGPGDGPVDSGVLDGATSTRFATRISRPDGPPVIEVVDETGAIATVSCTVCHTIRTPNRESRSAADLDEFHQGMTIEHGDLACLACHDPADYDSLRLADDRPVAFPEVMTLCSQCHGPQARDYAHGAHGGMNGYWDLRQGPRTRNNCVDCHDPHAPAFPKMRPTFKPRDRFLTPPGEREADPHG